jgi:N-acetylmuramoyl-L-alanine amidase
MARRSLVLLALAFSGGCVYSPHPLSQPSHDKEWVPLSASRPPASAAAPASSPAPQKPAALKPAPAAPRPLLDCTIALDPGHGGSFTGAIGRAGLTEKEINLDVALQVKDILESWGAKVVMTRTRDTNFSETLDVDLSERCRIVNRASPDVFLSIHTNFTRDPVPHGFEVYVPKNAASGRDQESRALAALLRGRLGEVWGPCDRGTKDDRNLHVLNGTLAPAVLVELEFVSNPRIEQQLASGSVRHDLADGIAKATLGWFTGRK